jgi:hypothetical protein
VTEITLTNGVKVPADSLAFWRFAWMDGNGATDRPIRLVQYDDTLPVAAVTLKCYDQEGQEQTYIPPTGATLRVKMRKPDDKWVLNDCLGVDAEGRVYFAFTLQMCVADGTGAWCNIQVTTENGTKHCQKINVQVERNAVQLDDIASTDEYRTLESLAKDVTDTAKIMKDNEAAIQSAYANMDAIKAAPANATAAAASAKEARSWAVGDTATRPGEGMDNAKYYAALAQQVSQGAVGWYPNYEALYAAHDTGYDGNWAIVGDTDTIWVWDSDTGVWKDTGESSRFANYYDKTQIDANFYGKTQIDAKLPKPVTVTVPASAWTSGDYNVTWDDGSTSSYNTCATVTVAGVTADSHIAVSDRTRVTDAVRMIAALEPGAGVVKFYANAAPTSAAVFVVEVSL